MATTLNRTGVTVTNDSGTPSSPVGDGTIINNAWVQTFCDRIDALLTGATFAVSGLFDADGFGTHTFDAGGTGGQVLSVRNTTAGTGNYGQVQVGNDGSATALLLRTTASSFTATGAYRQNAGHLVCDRAGGLVLAATGGKLYLTSGAANFGSVAIGTSDTGRNAHLEIVPIDGNGGNSILWGHPNTGFTSSFGGYSGGGQPFWAAYAYHSSTANTLARASGTNVPTVLQVETDGAWLWATGTAGTVDTTFTPTNVLKLTAGGQLQVGNTVSSTPSVAHLSYPNTGLSWASTAQLEFLQSNEQTFTWVRPNTNFGGNVFSVIAKTGGTGANAKGGGVEIYENSSGNRAASYLLLRSETPTSYYYWTDTSGNLRVHTAAPVEDNSVPDTAGTVVGTQTSNAAAKHLGEVVSPSALLARVLETPIRAFTYRHQWPGESFAGLVTDEAPYFGLDRDAAHPGGKSLNVVNCLGALFGSVQALAARVHGLEGGRGE